MEALSESARSVLGIVGDSLRVLWRHWPSLASLFLIGAALHGAFLWFAVWVSSYASAVSMFVLPLAPISVLIAMVLMLRHLAPSLPGLALSMSEGSRAELLRANLIIAVHVLIPFLAVYASQGMVKADLQAFRYESTVAEYYNQGFNADYSRVIFLENYQVIAMIVGALVLRKVIAGFDLSKNHLGIAAFAGYLEALWLITGAIWMTQGIDALKAWVLSRKVIVQIIHTFDGIVAVLGPIGKAISSLVDQFSTLVGQMGSLVIIPVAWMAVGATIYGSALPKAQPMMTPEQMTKRINQIPNPVRRLAKQVSEPVVSPVQNVLNAIGRVAVAGIIPMVFLCLLLVLASELRLAVVGLARTILGPHPGIFWWSVAPLVDVIAQCVYTVVAVTIIAATVNTIIVRQNEQAAEEEAAAKAAEEAAAAEAAAQGTVAGAPVVGAVQPAPAAPGAIAPAAN